ncbi:MAG: hypothetical protein ACE5JP_15835 [Candidatus Bipolaricaulia bacterium]
MYRFVVRDIGGIMEDCDLSDYCVNGRLVTDKRAAIRHLEQRRPVTVFQDGTVCRTDDGRCVDILINCHCSYTDEEFEELWREFGYPDSLIEE